MANHVIYRVLHDVALTTADGPVIDLITPEYTIGRVALQFALAGGAGTLSPQVSVDGVTFWTLTGLLSSHTSSTKVATMTTGGIMFFDVLGYRKFQARLTALAGGAYASAWFIGVPTTS